VEPIAEEVCVTIWLLHLMAHRYSLSLFVCMQSVIRGSWIKALEGWAFFSHRTMAWWEF
jgi:hypothetical protein